MIASNAVVWKLKSVNAISALVSNRVYPRAGVPQGTAFPYIVVDHPPGQQNLGGNSQGQGGVRKTSLAVYCYANKSVGGIEQADSIATLVDSNLAPTSGVTGSVSWNGTAIDHCTVRDHYEHVEIQQDGSESPWKAVCVVVDVFHLNCTS